jgi:hypothetical protein
MYSSRVSNRERGGGVEMKAQRKGERDKVIIMESEIFNELRNNN